MKCGLESHVLRSACDFVGAFGKALPLLIRELRAIRVHTAGDSLAVGVSRLGEHQHGRAEHGEEPASLHRVGELLLVAAGVVERHRTESPREVEMALAQLGSEQYGILREVAPRPELGARVAQLRHLVEDALERQHHTPIGELAHAPADRRGAYLQRRSSHRSRTSGSSVRDSISASAVAAKSSGSPTGRARGGGGRSQTARMPTRCAPKTSWYGSSPTLTASRGSTRAMARARPEIARIGFL